MNYYLLLIIIAIVAYFLFFRKNSGLVEKFLEQCRLQPIDKESISSLTKYVTSNVNDEIKKVSEVIPIGPVKIKGINNARIVSSEIGAGSSIQPCTKDDCVCQKTSVFPQGAILSLKNTIIVIEGKDLEISLPLGIKSKTDAKVTMTLTSATVETDCQQNAVITEALVSDSKVEFSNSNINRVNGMIGNTTDRINKTIQDSLIGKILKVGSMVGESPILCLNKKKIV